MIPEKLKSKLVLEITPPLQLNPILDYVMIWQQTEAEIRHGADSKIGKSGNLVKNE